MKKAPKTSLEETTKMLHKSHKDILELAETFTNEELFSKDTYTWVGAERLDRTSQATLRAIMTGR